MKKIILLFLIFLNSCGVKQTQTMMTSGDYDPVINNCVSKLQGNKNAKGKQQYVLLLEEAFAKAKERDTREISLWFKDANPKNLEKIFSAYQQLNYRQESIRPLLPLHILKENREAKFPMEDYSEQLVSSKNALTNYLYTNSKALLATKDKMSCRRAYDDLMYLESINSNYKDVNNLLNEAKNKGTDYVNVATKNATNVVIPNRLQSDLLDFSTFGLNDKWTEYHSNKQKGIAYDYGIVIHFRDIVISPERVNEKEFDKEKVIKDGVKKLLDSRGREVKDSLGKVIYVDNMKTIRVSIYEFSQIKSVQVTAKVDYTNLKNNQLLDTFPLSSNFVFQNVYARSRGDRRACEESYFPTFDRREVPFPTNEQMVYDCGEDLKAKLKAIINQHRINK
jgi:hypothetical protein